jgi:hypothetical protein
MSSCAVSFRLRCLRTLPAVALSHCGGATLELSWGATEELPTSKSLALPSVLCLKSPVLPPVLQVVTKLLRAGV